MTPWELLDTAPAPEGQTPLRLLRRGGEYAITIGANELMNSRLGGSEEALAELALDRLAARAAPRVLIGGLGMGFTLRAALAALGPAARVTVAELVPGVLDWARGPMAAMTRDCLDDPRVAVRLEDVATLIAAGEADYDAILLDVDNGPDGLTRAANDRLYTARGLANARAALRPGGVLAVWSAGPDPAFARRLGQAGFAVDEVKVRARANGKGPTHTIWFARVG